MNAFVKPVEKNLHLSILEKVKNIVQYLAYRDILANFAEKLLQVELLFKVEKRNFVAEHVLILYIEL